jgi:diguanylate cyclase (GGDEF)-like protein
VPSLFIYEEYSMNVSSILVVEGDEGLQNLLRRLLSQEGHRVTVVGSGQEAIRIAREIPVQVLLTDLTLPDIDGLTVLERILQIDSKMIGIVMTGFGSIDCAVKAMKAGAFDFLTKPFDNEVVVGSIKYGFHRGRSAKKPTELSSTYDYVTGLPTRRLFGTLLEQAVGRAAKTSRSLALLVVELEHFRMVAENQGRANGNVLVRVQAARVKGVLRSTETVARLAQDQFAMILETFTSRQDITTIVEKLQATVGLPLTLEGHELFVTCRIGVALYPQDAMEAEELITQAMQAVKMAKSEGQAVQFTSPIIAVSSPEPVSMCSPTAGRPS